MYFILSERVCETKGIDNSLTVELTGEYEDDVDVECNVGYVVEDSCDANLVCEETYRTSCTHNGTWSSVQMCESKTYSIVTLVS